ncbi:hydroxymethylbilane synthase, putative [Talaromyces stipitatus ATCC 10500]|uniref:Porphobilinogen deaminase n=1 Tax=Talaromyces stipitatus (strain ATCC 10500 / CBS 375.48 / QM 6759 / NRRL 1006) TaxID=441959 RepID=B8LY32_TALSN|nr:hydroxymethylbilane synthase, putative [Talaromyces stipitatus ATCC 10500]EED23277.1 hydroxymethylbilane synthase, putative [Talaromyces stipitatus ATCC 10500]
MSTAPLASERKTFNIGTRKSKLALAQTYMVVDALKKEYPQYEFNIKSKDTAGDRDKITAFKDMQTKNLWTEELEELLIGGQLDFIVHSLKDVPTLLPPTCALGGVLPREDPRDVLIVKPGLPYTSLAEIPAGSVVGTSSIRRTAQLAMKFPHLKVQSLRGNIDTRLAKLDGEDSPYTCIILAAAGLLRTGMGHRITQYLDSRSGSLLYAVGQGAIGIEVRSDDGLVLEMLNKVGDQKTFKEVLAERSLLRTIEGGCSAPLGVESEWINEVEGTTKLHVRSIIVSVDGKRHSTAELEKVIESAAAAETFGLELAQELIANGAGPILEEIKQNKVTS